MFIRRRITAELIELINQFPILGIIGPRQVGKTTLAKHLKSRIDKECLYLDIELPEDQNKLSEPEIFLENYRDKCLILDKIQQVLPETIDMYFYRRTESDLVLLRGITPIACIEIKYTAVPKLSRGLRSAMQDLGTERNFIVISVTSIILCIKMLPFVLCRIFCAKPCPSWCEV